jgi:hypothetical protein
MRLYNPLTNDFSYTWFDDNNKGHVLVLPSLVITELPEAQGKFMEKHLIDEIINQREDTKMGYEHQVEKIKKEVEVNDLL